MKWRSGSPSPNAILTIIIIIYPFHHPELEAFFGSWSSTFSPTLVDDSLLSEARLSCWCVSRCHADFKKPSFWCDSISEAEDGFFEPEDELKLCEESLLHNLVDVLPRFPKIHNPLSRAVIHFICQHLQDSPFIRSQIFWHCHLEFHP